jgi:hypothetical protein
MARSRGDHLRDRTDELLVVRLETPVAVGAYHVQHRPGGDVHPQRDILIGGT